MILAWLYRIYRTYGRGLFLLKLERLLAVEPRQVDKKRTAFAELALDPDAAVIKLDNFFTYEQAQPGTADGARSGVIDSVEFLE
jgi:hypothetical protein